MLNYVKTAKQPPRSHEVLMELRDISSMAMEHFEEKILPQLRKVSYHIPKLQWSKSCSVSYTTNYKTEIERVVTFYLANTYFVAVHRSSF